MKYQTYPTFLKISFVLLFFSSTISVKARNYLPRGSSFSIEEVSKFLTSPNEVFTCGFHGLGENAYWFAIWFTNSTESTVVWMANRDRPVNSQGSRISLQRGAMVLTDVDGSNAWESDSLERPSSEIHRAELLDSGNLVLKNQSGDILWQSFDWPTDTLLPNQVFTTAKKLVSSLGKGSYLSGYFNFLFDNDNVLKLMYDGPDISSLYWPDPGLDVFQNGRTNYNSSRIAVLDKRGQFTSSDRTQFNASDMSLGINRRLTIDYDGNLRLYSLMVNGSWEVTWVALQQQCSIHGMCGKNGICVYTPEPKCSCPPGYEMSDPSDWNKGCEPMFNDFCSNTQEVEFVTIPNTDYYGFDLYYNPTLSEELCKQACLTDCRCKAYNYRLDGRGLCFTKNELFNGFSSPNFDATTYIKLPLNLERSVKSVLNVSDPTCERDAIDVELGSAAMYKISQQKVRWVYLYSFAVAIGAIELLFAALGWWFLFRKQGITDLYEDGYKVISNQFRRFSYSELKKATKKFKEELGRGGFGCVYKGVLGDKRIVAVKRLGDVFQGEQEFWAEVSTIGRINHMNLVRMWGYCSERNHKLLVYEFVENLSLDRHLFSIKFIGWKERFKVALGVAKGLAYLHHECLEWIIHCDVKPENVLLDGDFEPKIADFGLAKLSQRGAPGSKFTTVRGTVGYMAPEWTINLPITAKVDVYSYGVVILEMVKGARLSNSVVENPEEQEAALSRFVRRIRRNIQSGEESWLEDAVDSRLKGEFSRKQAATMLEIGISCVDDDRMKRPTMNVVVQRLLDCEDGKTVQEV